MEMIKMGVEIASALSIVIAVVYYFAGIKHTQSDTLEKQANVEGLIKIMDKKLELFEKEQSIIRTEIELLKLRTTFLEKAIDKE